MTQFEFKEQIAQTYLTRFSTPPMSVRRLPSYSTKGEKRVLDDLRFEGMQHYLVETREIKRNRCSGEGCQKRPFSECSKCGVSA